MCIYIDHKTDDWILIGSLETIKMFKQMFADLIDDANKRGLIKPDQDGIQETTKVKDQDSKTEVC